ncbi:MAG TPA: Rossmann-like and DUF2520 domain-containing protein [Terriglobales bacterium]|nr:Rossmann-like and DUF2520 domain-containing protein [Terriglobales bacterium]
MARKLSVTIVGPGSLGSALAQALHAAGIQIVEIVYRSPASASRAKALATAVGGRAIRFDEVWTPQSRSSALLGRAGAPVPTVVWLCVGDSTIASVASEMASRGSWKGSVVLHSSGALSADELSPLRRKGAKVASVHPMMTFVRSSAPSMKNVAFALEGDRAAISSARKLVKALDGYAFVLSKKDKPLYHALGAFVSPLIIAQMGAAERIGRELGLKPENTRKVIAPILQQTIRNYIEHGPAAAFSGPIVRGDAETVRKNLAALKRVRGAQEIYRALAKVAIEELPSKDADAMKKIVG